jgi:hypothetical protein
MTTENKGKIRITGPARAFIAANGGHATLYLTPRPAADG